MILRYQIALRSDVHGFSEGIKSKVERDMKV